MLAYVVESQLFDSVMLGLIIVNMFCLIIEADVRVRSENDESPHWLMSLAYVFLPMYMLEILARLCVDGLSYFRSAFNVLDVTVVFIDLIVVIVGAVIGDSATGVSAIRIVRILRLMRVVRTCRVFRELWLMLHGMVSAMKAMLWAVVLIAATLLIFSLVAVQILHPTAKQLAADNMFDEGCARCPHAFDSIGRSAATWWLLIFAGEMWEAMAVPMMERKPYCAPVFILAYVLVNLCLLNLVLTVIVDRAQEARAEDGEHALKEKRLGLQNATKKMVQLFEEMDQDGSGHLTLDEIELGFDSNDEFFAVMKLMDVERVDLGVVFQIIDEDHSGTVTAEEFAQQLYKMKAQESSTLLKYIEHHILTVKFDLAEQMKYIKEEIAPRVGVDEKKRISMMKMHEEVTKKTALQKKMASVADGLGEPSTSNVQPSTSNAATPKHQETCQEHSWPHIDTGGNDEWQSLHREVTASFNEVRNNVEAQLKASANNVKLFTELNASVLRMMDLGRTVSTQSFAGLPNQYRIVMSEVDASGNVDPSSGDVAPSDAGPSTSQTLPMNGAAMDKRIPCISSLPVGASIGRSVEQDEGQEKKIFII